MKRKVILTYIDVSNKICEESVWVELMKDETYKVLNVPFFAPNIALYDIITATKEGNSLHFDDLITPSGHSTIQIVILNKELKNQVIKEIEMLGCSWEGMENQEYLAVDVPPNIDYNSIINYLDKEVANETLDYKEACVA